jgi:hypothetical protein
MQTLQFATRSAQAQEQQNIYLGIVKPLTFPYNLFLNFSNLMDPDLRYVYFFVYVLGAKRIVMWGVYNKLDQTFSIDGSCRYAPSQLAGMVKEWQAHNTKYVANSVANRGPLRNLINQLEQHGVTYTGRGVVNLTHGTGEGLWVKPITSYSQYLQDKFILGFYEGKLSREEVDDRYPELLDDFIIEFEKTTKPSPVMGDYNYKLGDYLADLAQVVRSYENSMNRTDLDTYRLPGLAENLQDVVAKITQRFYDAVKTGQFETSTYYDALEQCPDLQACQIENEAGCSVYFYGDVDRGNLNPHDRRGLV